jgi:hypothetical protein
MAGGGLNLFGWVDYVARIFVTGLWRGLTRFLGWLVSGLFERGISIVRRIISWAIIAFIVFLIVKAQLK